MQETSLLKVTKEIEKLRALTNAGMELRPHILHFCQSQPSVARLALIDLLQSTIHRAKDIADPTIFSLLEANLSSAPETKVKTMLDRLFTTMVNESRTSNPPLPYCKMALNASYGPTFPHGSFDDPDDLLSAYVKCKTDDRHDSRPMPMTAAPAGITDKDELQKFWNPPNPQSTYWEERWVEGNVIVIDGVHVYGFCACMTGTDLPLIAS